MYNSTRDAIAFSIRAWWLQVLLVYDHAEDKFRALKIIHNSAKFHAQVKWHYFLPGCVCKGAELMPHCQGLLELNVLRQCSDADVRRTRALVHILTYFYFRSHLCLLFPVYQGNMYEVRLAWRGNQHMRPHCLRCSAVS